MGLTTFGGNYPTLSDATIAKNYLTDKELNILNRIVSMYLDYAELQAIEENTMTMEDWILLKPSDIELHYLRSIKDLEMIGTKN